MQRHSSSSRMRVVNHNWSATKAAYSTQSVAEISRRSVLLGDRIRQFETVRHRLGLATRTQISVCKSPFPFAGTAVSLSHAKTVQQRPLLPSLKSMKEQQSIVRMWSELSSTLLQCECSSRKTTSRDISRFIKYN